jgi:hypothetical protein
LPPTSPTHREPPANASGTATLNIVLVGGFVPTSAQSFQVIAWSSESGTFSTVNDPAGVVFAVSFEPLDLKLSAM